MILPLPPVLIVDDERNMRLSLESALRQDRYSVRSTSSAEEALKLLSQEEFLVVISDARLSGMSGYEFLRRVRADWPELPLVIITAYATPKLAVEAIKAGALDYLAKPFAPEELLHVVGRCAERYRLLTENASLRAQAVEPYQLDQIIGESPKIQELRKVIQTVAPTNATVLIMGESGSGKELIAGALHSLSRRQQHNYVKINCAAIPETLLESELFGYEKGAFTGAVKRKAGRVEEAHEGTLFLDEIGDMSRPLQAKLLRFLEDGTFARVGGTEELRVDVRIIAATNRDIVAAIQQNIFREDLFHRLNVVQFLLPPLRERQGDILPLADHFLRSFSSAMKSRARRFSRMAQQKLLSHHWPGNIRELRNVVERAVILDPGEVIQPESLPDFEVEGRLRKEPERRIPRGQSLEEAVANFERDLVVRTLESNHFSLNKTADCLKISRHALRYRMQRLNITAEPLVEDESPPGVKTF